MNTPANWYAGPPAPKQYDAAFFLDNEQTHIDTVGTCKDITTRKVPGSHAVRSTPFKNPRSQMYVNSLSESGRFAAIVLQKLSATLANEHGEYYDFGSGIQKEDVAAVKEWVQEQKAQGKKDLAVLFDWDRTITFIEGFIPFEPGFGPPAAEYFRQYIPQRPELSIPVHFLSITPVEGFVEYYVGGMDRLKMLQELMAYLTSEGVDICILTNNASCFKYPIPLEQMTMVITNNVPVTFICARMYPSKREALHRNEKAKILFEKVCKAVGGKRKTRRRKT